MAPRAPLVAKQIEGRGAEHDEHATEYFKPGEEDRKRRARERQFDRQGPLRPHVNIASPNKGHADTLRAEVSGPKSPAVRGNRCEVVKPQRSLTVKSQSGKCGSRNTSPGRRPPSAVERPGRDLRRGPSASPASSRESSQQGRQHSVVSPRPQWSTNSSKAPSRQASPSRKQLDSSPTDGASEETPVRTLPGGARMECMLRKFDQAVQDQWQRLQAECASTHCTDTSSATSTAPGSDPSDVAACKETPTPPRRASLADALEAAMPIRVAATENVADQTSPCVWARVIAPEAAVADGVDPQVPKLTPKRSLPLASPRQDSSALQVPARAGVTAAGGSFLEGQGTSRTTSSSHAQLSPSVAQSNAESAPETRDAGRSDPQMEPLMGDLGGGVQRSCSLPRMLPHAQGWCFPSNHHGADMKRRPLMECRREGLSRSVSLASQLLSADAGQGGQSLVMPSKPVCGLECKGRVAGTPPVLLLSQPVYKDMKSDLIMAQPMWREKPDSLSEADGLKMPEARDVHEHSYVPAVSSAFRPAHGSSGVPMQVAGPDRQQLGVVRPLRTSLPGPRLTLSSIEKICHTHGQRQWGQSIAASLSTPSLPLVGAPHGACSMPISQGVDKQRSQGAPCSLGRVDVGLNK
mmetsp:Transcript_37989/g.101201  ORF Transcript_37989/g.101201 Transcript_37989/m.101201 type:complete len:635 (-) Transcript_37989:507-2411(-)